MRKQIILTFVLYLSSCGMHEIEVQVYIASLLFVVPKIFMENKIKHIDDV